MRNLTASRWLWLATWLVVVPAALGFREPEYEAIGNFDARTKGKPSVIASEQRAAADILRRQVPGVQVHFDDVRGLARHVHSTTSFLTGPRSSGKSVKAAAAAAINQDDPHRPTKVFLDSHPEIFGHGSEVLRGTRLERDYTTRHNGLRTAVWQQHIDGIPVFEGVMVSHTTTNGELVAISSQVVPDAVDIADRSLPNRAAFLTTPTISLSRAVELAGANIGDLVDKSTLVLKERVGKGPAARHTMRGGNMRGPSDAKLVWLPTGKGALRLCWEVVMTKRSSGEAFRILVDAASGEVWVRHCMTAYLTDATFRVYTGESPSPFSPGSATPSSYQPPVTNRELVSMLAVINTNASPNGWIDDGVFETVGNNVDAHLDRDGNDAPDLPRPTATNRVFDFPQNFSLSPTETNNQSSAVVQLFYWCNWVHDRLYELGFTETAGNFQSNNFGRGGFGNDALQADAQDYPGFNNANFTTFADGTAPRMQMYLFSGPFPPRDGDIDAEIVIHEYIHGLTGRRVGNGVSISAKQTQGLGEGWSDFYALALLAQPDASVGGNYPMAAYISYLFGGTLTQNYYYGIRRYPYSTNLLVNPLTLKDIDPIHADSHVGVPRSPALGNSATEVHNMGEVWCVTLWDARANLINKLGHSAGNQLILQLVTDALSLSPANPTYLEARDAIIEADLINNAGANYKELWSAFAKRGMGASATIPPNSTTIGVQEAFDMPDDLRITPNSGLTSSGVVGGPFYPGAKSYMLTNFGTNTISWTVGKTDNWLAIVLTNGVLPPAATTNVLISLKPDTLALPAGVYTNVVVFTNISNGATQSREFILAVGQPDYFTEFFDALDNDLSFQSFTFTPDGSGSFYNACRQVASSFPVDPTGAIPLSLTDDSYTFITVTNGSHVSLYGTNYGGFYIGSNGYLTFDTGDNQYYETLANHFNRVRVSGLFLDQFPDAVSIISWKQLSDRVAVTWQNIPEFNTTNRNNFQIELFFDGRIRMTYLSVMSHHGIAGLSQGKGVPSGFVESDLSQYSMCLPPLIVTLPDAANEGVGVLTNQGLVSIGLTMTNDVVVQLASSDATEVTVTNSVTILAGQTNAFFDLNVVDDNILDGSQKVYVMATALGFPSGAGCMVVNDNESAILSVVLPDGVLENGGVFTNLGVVTINTPPPNDVSVALASSNPKLQIPANVTVSAGQTSAVFNLVIVDNNLVDGTQSATVTAHVANWIDGVASMAIFDNETSYDFLDHFQLGPVAPTQYVGAPFALTIAAKTPPDAVFTNFSGPVKLIGLRNLATNESVRVMAYVGHADLNGAFSNTLAAISSVFTNYTVTTTTNTNSASLQADLVSQQVFLMPQQTNAPTNFFNQLGGAWSNVLRDFTARGGFVIVCSSAFDEYQILTQSGLMDLQRVVTGSNATLQVLLTNALTLNLSNSFNVTNVSLYSSSNATAVIGVPPGSNSAVYVANYGLGHAVLLGADFVQLGSPLDRVMGNAVKWAQSSGYQTIAVTPSSVSNFFGGTSMPSVVSVAQTVTNMFLAVCDGNGHSGTGNLFSVVFNQAPVASNLSFTINADSATNLPLVAFDQDGQSLTYSIASQPTNGLLSALFSTNGVFVYTPAHAFVGTDLFTFTVNDGITNSLPALVNVTVLSLADTNANGIPDSWEVSYGMSLSTNSANADPDGDGLTNFQEYLANSNPNNPQSGFLKPQIAKLANGHYLITWCSVGGTRYRVQFGDGDVSGNYNGSYIDIVRPAWLEIDPATVGVAATNSFVDDFSLTAGAPLHGHRYYRIKLVR